MKTLDKQKAQKLIMVVVIALLTALVFGFIVSSNRHYQSSWQDNTEKVMQIKQQRRKNSGEDSKQPVPPGMKEKDIEKWQGKGYGTY